MIKISENDSKIYANSNLEHPSKAKSWENGRDNKGNRYCDSPGENMNKIWKNYKEFLRICIDCRGKNRKQ